MTRKLPSTLTLALSTTHARAEPSEVILLQHSSCSNDGRSSTQREQRIAENGQLADVEIARLDPQGGGLPYRRRDPQAPAPLRFDSEPGATHMIVTGEIKLDLEQIDAFEIRAYAVAPGGRAIDDPKRGRGVLARRAGRWPKIATAPDTTKPAEKRAVLGFDVDDDGRTMLPHEAVSLLRVQGLPDPRDALHPIERAAQPNPSPACGAPSPDPPIVLGSAARLVRLDVGALFRMAMLGQTVTLPVATDGAPQKPANRPLTLTRPNEISDARAS